jgi:hypothetical protein
MNQKQLSTRELINNGKLDLVRGDEECRFVEWLPDDPEHDAILFDKKNFDSFAILKGSIETWSVI